MVGSIGGAARRALEDDERAGVGLRFFLGEVEGVRRFAVWGGIVDEV